MKTLLKVLSIFTLLALQSPLSFADSDVQPEILTDEVFVLKQLLGAQLLTDEMNLASIQSLEKCMNQDSTGGSYQNQVLQAFSNEIVSIEEACEEVIEKHITRPLKESLQEVRFHLALAQPAARDDNPLFSESLSRSYDEFRWSNKLHHKAKGFFSISLSPLSDTERARVASAYFNYSQEICAAYMMGSFAKDLSLAERRYNAQINFIDKSKICDDILSGPLLMRSGLAHSIDVKDHMNIVLLQDIAEKYYQKAASQRIRWQASHKKQYSALLSRHPFLLYIKTQFPKQGEIQSALREIQKNAESRLKRHTKIIGKKDFSNQNILKNKDKILELLNFDMTLSYMDSILRQRNSLAPNLSSIIDSLKKEKQAKDLESFKWTIGTVVVANLICFIPFGKLMSAASKLLFKKACFTALGLPVNTYFLQDAYRENRSDWRNYFSTFDGEKYLNEFDVVRASQKMLYFELLFLPLGIQAGFIFDSLKKLRRSPEGF